MPHFCGFRRACTTCNSLSDMDTIKHNQIKKKKATSPPRMSLHMPRADKMNCLLFCYCHACLLGSAMTHPWHYTTYGEGQTRGWLARVLLVRKLIIYPRVAPHKKSSVCKPAPAALPIIGSTSDCPSFLSALYLCSHGPSW